MPEEIDLDPLHRMTNNSYTAALPAYQALASFVQAGDGADKKTLDDIVQKFRDLAKAAESALEDFLWDAYSAIFEVARETPPEKQGALVEFIQRLRETTVTASDGQPLHLGEHVVWKDLPTMGWVARDLWNFDVLDASMSKEDKTKWDNLTAFLAQLTARAAVIENPRSDPLDYSMYALWTLRDAFEKDHPESADTAAAVRQASLWIKYSGEALQKLSANDQNLEDKCGIAGTKFENREWKGFNKERWAVWTEAFTAAQASLPDAETKELAGQAVGIMKSK